jgi:hypothetical protein
MRVTAKGFVGVGTSNPQNLFTVNGGDLAVTSGGNAANAGGALTFGTSYGEINGYTKKMASIKGMLQFADLANKIESGGLGFFTRDVGLGNVGAPDQLERMRITMDGDVGIGTSAPGAKLEVIGTAAKTAGGTWAVSSDKRIKEDIVLADLDKCYDNVKNIPLKYYKWRDDVYDRELLPDRHRLGWIAQDVEAVFPKSVVQVQKNGLDDFRMLDADQIYTTLYGAVQKLQIMSEDGADETLRLQEVVGVQSQMLAMHASKLAAADAEIKDLQPARDLIDALNSKVQASMQLISQLTATVESLQHQVQEHLDAEAADAAPAAAAPEADAAPAAAAPEADTAPAAAAPEADTAPAAAAPEADTAPAAAAPEADTAPAAAPEADTAPAAAAPVVA